MKTVHAGSLACLLAAGMTARAIAAATPCDQLASLKITGGEITLAQLVPAGTFMPPGRGNGNGEAFGRLGACCRVSATLTPSADSDIKIEVWLPAAGWNNKFQAVGNGGWNGNIVYPSLVRALER